MRRFEIGFADGVTGFEPKEFEDIRVADAQFLARPFDRPYRPIAGNVLDLVESAFKRVFEGEEFNKVVEAKPQDRGPRIRSQFGNQ